MGKVALIALALAGCNQVYGLDQTQLQKDAPDPDAPYACKEAAPSFRGTPIPVSVGGDLFHSYSISLDRRIAVALGPAALYEGPGDTKLTMGASLTPSPPPQISSPRLSPEGDELFMRHDASPCTVVRYSRTADNQWMNQAVIAAPALYTEISAPTERALGPRRMLMTHGNTELREYVETAPDSWQPVGAAYKPAELGLVDFLTPNLTPDGLHMLMSGVGTNVLATLLVYASRERVEDRFSKPVFLDPFFGSPTLYEPYLLSDCSRLYFTIIGPGYGVYYVEPN